MDSKHTFFDNVFEVVALIPEGRVTSYGAIAAYLGAKKASRSVGWALNASIKSEQPLPAHRVVNRLGILSGRMHFSSPDEMEKRLKAEGHQIVNDQIVDFQKVFWEIFFPRASKIPYTNNPYFLFCIAHFSSQLIHNTGSWITVLVRYRSSHAAAITLLRKATSPRNYPYLLLTTWNTIDYPSSCCTVVSSRVRRELTDSLTQMHHMTFNHQSSVGIEKPPAWEQPD